MNGRKKGCNRLKKENSKKEKRNKYKPKELNNTNTK